MNKTAAPSSTIFPKSIEAKVLLSSRFPTSPRHFPPYLTECARCSSKFWI